MPVLLLYEKGGGDNMKIKLEYFKWMENKPVMTEFEGTLEEFKKVMDFRIIQKEKG